MKKLFFLSLFAFFIFSASVAQTGSNGIGIRAEVGFPIGDFGDFYKTGWGGSAIGLFGVGTSGHLTLRSGYMKFKFDGNDDWSTNLIPIMAGYRHSFSGFYLHPQAGVGMLGSKVSGGESEHDTKFGWAIGAGIGRGGLDAGVRYERISTSAKDFQFSFIGVHLGYNFMFDGGTMSK